MTDLISIGRSGLLAYQGALSAVGENVANANNDGYARRQVVLTEQTVGSGPMFLSRNSTDFQGVQAATVTRAWDQFKAADAWNANSDNSYASARSQYLGSVQTTLDDSDSGIGTKLTAIFTSASALAANPTDSTLRQTMLSSIQDAAGSIGQAAANLDKVQAAVGQQASTGVDQLNSALANLSRINTALKSSPAGTSGRASLEDQRDALIGTVSGYLGVDVSLDQYGAATLKLNDFSGPALLSTDNPVPAMVGLNKASDGRLQLTLTSGTTVAPANATSGSLAGLVDSAGIVADRKSQLDGLANNLATGLNTWQAQGKDLNGNSGAALLTGTTAETLALATTDTSAIAASDGTTANGNLLAISSLRQPDGTEATWHGIVTQSALQTQSAQTAASSASTAKDAAYTTLDDVSGVDLDTEAAQLLRFQQAYSASSKIIQAAQTTFQAVLDLF